jgi:hypothetical protein
MNFLKRYWIVMEDASPPLGTRLGIGVTALGLDDAMMLIAECIYRARPIPDRFNVQVGIRMTDLDPKHVIPNMGDPNERGVWFPLGYS